MAVGNGYTTTVILAEAESEQPFVLVLIILYFPAVGAVYVLDVAPTIKILFRYHCDDPPEEPVRSVPAVPEQKPGVPLNVTKGFAFCTTLIGLGNESAPQASDIIQLYFPAVVTTKVCAVCPPIATWFLYH